MRYGFIVLTILFFVLFLVTLPSFRMSSTMFSMLKFTSVVAIAGLGITFTMVVGGLDLSVGATAGMAVTVAAMTMVIYAQTGPVAVLAVLGAGALIGAFNAFLIVALKIPDLARDACHDVLDTGLEARPRGRPVGLVWSDPPRRIGRPRQVHRGIHRDQQRLARSDPVSRDHVGASLAIATWFFLSRTKWGRIMYAVGTNPEAARLAGARVGRYKALAYIISGVFASIAGMILASRIRQGDISAGNSLLLDAVAVALVGYSVLGANKPNAFGTTLGALLIGILLTGTTMMNFPYYWQDVVKGLVLVVALIFSFTLSRRKQRHVAAVPI